MTPNEALDLDAACLWSGRIARQMPRCDRLPTGWWCFIPSPVYAPRRVGYDWPCWAFATCEQKGEWFVLPSNGPLATNKIPVGNKGNMEINAEEETCLRDLENVGCAEERKATRSNCAADEDSLTMEKVAVPCPMGGTGPMEEAPSQFSRRRNTHRLQGDAPTTNTLL